MHALDEDGFGLVPRAPCVQGVDGRKPVLQDGRQPLRRGLPDPGEGNPRLARGVDEVGPLTTRVVDGCQAAGAGSPPGHHELERVGHLVERFHPKDPVRIEQRLVGAVLACQRA